MEGRIEEGRDREMGAVRKVKWLKCEKGIAEKRE